jgi:LysM repeat protein
MLYICVTMTANMTLFRILLLSMTLIQGSLLAQTLSINEADQKFIHYIDPVGLVIIEKVDQGTTLYSLSRKYNVSMDLILSSNPDLDPGAVPLGYPVNIPIFSKAISFTPPQAGDDSIPVFYRVEPKETLYRISKVYLGTSPDTIKGLNPRVKEGLSIGQVLHLGWYNPQKNTQNPAGTAPPTGDIAELYPVTDYTNEYKTEGKVIREQKGLAVWKPGNMQSHYYVLHPTAKIGSYMEVTNPMLHRTLTAKVAGNIPPGIYPTHVGLVVSPSVARALGVLDQQFFARWRFVE